MNNRANFSAAIAAQSLRGVIDGKYVYDGQHWFTLGCYVSNYNPWEQLRGVLSTRTAVMARKHVYNYAGIVGNECVDELANTGRLSHQGRL